MKKLVSQNRKSFSSVYIPLFLLDAMLSAGKLEVVSSGIIELVSDVFVLAVAFHPSALSNNIDKNVR